jgi:hypothetical protein
MRTNNCTACRFQRDGVKSRIAIPHTCEKSKLNFYEYKDVEVILKDGIVYIEKLHPERYKHRYTIYLKDKPGIIGYVDNIEDGPAEMQRILKAIEGWDD